MPTVRSYHACDFALMHCVSIYPTPNERRLTQRAALQRATHDWNLRCNVIKRASYTAQHTVRVMQRATSVVPSRTGAPMNARTSLARIDLGACERPVSPKRSRDGKFPETFRKLSGSLQKTCSAQTSLSCKLRSSTGEPVRASPPSGRQARARADRSHARQVPGSSHRVTRGARRHMGSDASDEYRTVRAHAAGSRRMKTRRTRT